MTTDAKEPFIEFEYSSVRAKADSCLGCVLLRDVVERYIPANLVFFMRMKLGYHHTLTLSTSFADQQYRGGWWDHPHCEIQIYKLEGTYSPWESISERNEVTGCTGDQVSLEWAKEAIRKCCDEDKNCESPAEAELPTRILDIGSHEKEDDIKTVALLESSGKQAQYACLSHCWGDPELITKTTAETLASYKKGIALTALPKTFQEAILFTHRLGIRYLWIDSL